jgi:uncharacterized protein YdaT
MPWSTSDVSGKTKKAKSPKRKRQWRDIANSALKRGESEATAIKMASGVIAKESRAKKMGYAK